MKVVVTGSSGFVGRHLLAALVHHGHGVIAVSRREAADVMIHNVSFVQANISDPSAAALLLDRYKPDAVIHLAAQSNVKLSWDEPADTFTVNTAGAMHWLSAIRGCRPSALLLSIGSGEEYGLTGRSGAPLSESDPCLPQNPYAISKYAAGQLLLQLARRDGLAVRHARAFNHFGPGQLEGYVLSDFAAQIARIELGLAPPILYTGELTARRDFTDVRDVAEAYVRLLDSQLETGVYNVCSGTARPIGDVLSLLLEYARVRIKAAPDPDRLRPSEVPCFVGSREKLTAATGWMPERSFEASVRETLDWWRSAIASGAAARPS